RRTHAERYSSVAAGRHGKKARTRKTLFRSVRSRSVGGPDGAGRDRLFWCGSWLRRRIFEHAHRHACCQFDALRHRMERGSAGLAHVWLAFAHAGDIADSILCLQKSLDGIDVFETLPVWPDIKGKSQQNEGTP